MELVVMRDFDSRAVRRERSSRSPVAKNSLDLDKADNSDQIGKFLSFVFEFRILVV